MENIMEKDFIRNTRLDMKKKTLKFTVMTEVLN